MAFETKHIFRKPNLSHSLSKEIAWLSELDKRFVFSEFLDIFVLKITNKTMSQQGNSHTKSALE